MTVATMKKNNNINTISGKEAVDIAGSPPSFFFLNFDILFSLNSETTVPLRVFVETLT